MLVNLRKENENLKAENVDLCLRLKADKNSDVTSIETEMKAEVGRAAKYFVVFMSPSISTESFGFDKPQFLYDSPERFQGNNSKYGITAELYHAIPVKYMSYLVKHEALKKEVCSLKLLSHYYETNLWTSFPEFLNCLSTGRSLALDRFRTNASHVFKVFNLDGGDLDPSKQLDQTIFAKTAVRSQHPRVQALLGLKDGGKTFSKLPPVLFAQENTSVLSTLFLNPTLFRVCRVSLI